MTVDTSPLFDASLDLVREQFPSLNRPAIFFDNPGGTQISRLSAGRIQRYLMECNANHGGAFATSVQSDAVLAEAHAAMADFLNAARPEEIIFGNNMTSLTLHISRTLAQTLDPGDEIVLTHLDHDANVSPWLLAARDRGCRVTWIDFDVEDCTLKMNEVKQALERRPKLLAFGYASNAVGTINPVQNITRMAHAAGALVYVDAVQFAPHGPIDVQDLGVDFLVCSSYKYFGPHAGVLYGRYELLDGLKAYKVRPAPDSLPGKFETGTQNHEGIAGVLGALEYFEWLGKTFGSDQTEALRERGYTGRKLELKKATTALRSYEFELSRALLSTLDRIPGLRLYGIADPGKVDQRVPTFSFTLEGKHPRSVAEALAEAHIYVWDGNYYALEVTTRLGLEASGGMVRVGAVHYNTLDEVARLGEALKKIA
jgi:cysteine desulfurase family protein (TIGR01976 family)